MKNSKILSLLTAGALVVSSFSGLAMNGGVARAAFAGAATMNMTWPTEAKLVGGVYQIAAGEKVTATLTNSNSGTNWLGIAALSSATDPATGAGTASTNLVVSSITGGTAGSATHTKTSNNTTATLTTEFTALDVARDTGWIAGVEDSNATGANIVAALDGTVAGVVKGAEYQVDVRPFVTEATITAGTAGIAAVGGFYTDATTNTLASVGAAADEYKISAGKGTITRYIKLSDAATAYFKNTAAANGMKAAAITVNAGLATNPATNVTGVFGKDVASIDFQIDPNDRSKGVLAVTFSVDPTGLADGTVYYVKPAYTGVFAATEFTVKFVGGATAGNLDPTTWNDINFTSTGATATNVARNTGVKLGDAKTWDEENGNFYLAQTAVLNEVTVPVSSKTRTLAFNWGKYTVNNISTKEAVVPVTNAVGAGITAGAGLYAVADSSDPSVAVVSAVSGTNGAYGIVTVSPRNVGQTTITVDLYNHTGAGVVGTHVGSTYVVLNIVAAPGETAIFVDGREENNVILTAAKTSAQVYVQAIDGGFIASNNIKFYSGDTRIVDLADADETGHVTVTAAGNGTTVLYAVPEALVERFDAEYSNYINGTASNVVSHQTRNAALAYAYNRVYWKSVGGDGLRQVNVRASGAARTVYITQEDVRLTEAKIVKDENRVFTMKLNDNNYTAAATASNTGVKYSVASDNADIAKVEKVSFNTMKVTGVAAGTAKITVTAEYLVNGVSEKKTADLAITVVAEGEEPTPEKPQPGEPVKEDGVTGIVNEDGETVTVTDVAVVSKTITIPETIDGLTVTAIDAQAFKKSSAKTVYVYAPVEIINKGAFKAAKVKKVYFYQPEALKTVGKNAFKKTNAKVVGVGAAFSDDAAKQLTKAGAKSVKNNGTAK